MSTVGLTTPELVERFIFGPVPHHKALGLVLDSIGAKHVAVRLPYDAKLVGDPTSGVLHGGAITSLLDSTLGCAVFSALRSPRRVATLDLRIDYMRPASAGKDVVGLAECYRITRHVAFARAIAHDGDPDDPVASAAATFAIFAQKSKPKPEENAP